MAALSLTARSLLNPTMTNIIIGPEETKFSVHKALLCERAGYFLSAYRSGLQEAQQNRFKFDDIDSAHFRILVQWMYTNEIYLDEASETPLQLHIYSDGDDENDEDYRDADNSENGDDESEPPEEYEENLDQQEQDQIFDEMDEFDVILETMNEEQRLVARIFPQYYETPSDLDEYQLDVLLKIYRYETEAEVYRPNWEALLHEKRAAGQQLFATLLDLYILADRFDVQAFKVQLIDYLHAKRDSRPDGLGNFLPLDFVNKAFENLPEKSPLCRWLIYVFAFDWNPVLDDAEKKETRKRLPQEFILEVLLLYALRFRGVDSSYEMVEPELCTFHEHETYEEVEACRERRGEPEESWTLTPTDFEPETDVVEDDDMGEEEATNVS